MENTYQNITLAAPTTTTIASRPCILSRIIVNKAAATGVITLYDGDASTGTLIGTITMPATLLANQVSLNYGDICLKKGLTVVTSTAAQDLTVAWRPTA